MGWKGVELYEDNNAMCKSRSPNGAKPDLVGQVLALGEASLKISPTDC